MRWGSVTRQWFLGNARCRGARSGEGLELVDRLRPVLFEQSRERAIGEELSVSLASRAIVGLVACIPDSLHWTSAGWTGFPIPAVYCHLIVKGSDLCRKLPMRLLAQAVSPLDENVTCRLEEICDFFVGQAIRVLYR